MKNIIAAVAVFVSAGLSAAEMAPAEKKDFKVEWGGPVIVSGDALSARAACRIQSAADMPVSPAKKYRLSGEFRVVDGKDVKMYFGLIPLDAKKRFIGPRNVVTLYRSEAKLAADAKKGSKTVTLKDVKRPALFKAHPHKNLAFNTDNSGKYADLPNFDIAGGIVKTVANADKTLTVTLKSPLPADYKADSGVRIQMNGGTYLTVAGEKEELNVTPQWQTFEGVTVPGEVHAHTRKQLRTGTKSVRIIFYALKNKENTAKARLEFRNIKLQEIK